MKKLIFETTERFFRVGLLIVLAMASACASVPMAQNSADREAKNFNVPAGKSRIYIYRNEALGMAVRITLALDGRIMGQTAPNTYHVWDVKPGYHEISCVGEGNVAMGVDAKPGEAVYVWQEMKMGLVTAGCSLHQQDAAEGQTAIRDCGLAKSF